MNGKQKNEIIELLRTLGSRNDNFKILGEIENDILSLNDSTITKLYYSLLPLEKIDFNKIVEINDGMMAYSFLKNYAQSQKLETKKEKNKLSFEQLEILSNIMCADKRFYKHDDVLKLEILPNEIAVKHIELIFITKENIEGFKELKYFDLIRKKYSNDLIDSFKNELQGLDKKEMHQKIIAKLVDIQKLKYTQSFDANSLVAIEDEIISLNATNIFSIYIKMCKSINVSKCIEHFKKANSISLSSLAPILLINLADKLSSQDFDFIDNIVYNTKNYKTYIDIIQSQVLDEKRVLKYIDSLISLKESILEKEEYIQLIATKYAPLIEEKVVADEVKLVRSLINNSK